MPTVFRRRLRRVRRGAAYTLAVGLVLLALVLGTASQVLPLAEQNPDRVATWLSARAGRPISFDAVATAWTRRGPLLQLDGLRVGEGADAFTIGDAEMLVSIYAGLLPGVPLSELRLRGLELVLEREADGRWQVRGLPGPGRGGGDPFAALEGLGELQVVDGRLRVVSAAHGVDASVPQVDLRLRVDGDLVHAGLRAWPQAEGGDAGAGQPVDATLRLERGSGDGRAWVSASQVEAGPWAPLLAFSGVQVADGSGSAQVYARITGKRISEVVVDANLERVRLQATDNLVPALALDAAEGLVLWRREAGGWRLEAPRLALEHGGRRHDYGGVLVAGGDRPAARAGQVELAPLLQVAALSNRFSPGLRQWISEAAPGATLREIEVATGVDGRIRATGMIEGLGFRPVGDRPGMRGLAGRLTGDAAGLALELDPARSLEFDWPSGFGVVHTVALRGTISGWRDADGWSLGTGALRVQGQDVGLDARGVLRWEAGGGRPWIDLAADIDRTRLPVARGFLVRHLMPATLQQWLDDALVAGELVDGRAVITGDLDDWPFSGADGRFEARGRIEDGVVRYQPDWPAAEAVEAELAFIGDGFDVHGTAGVGGFEVHRIRAAMDSYDGAELEVDASGSGDVEGLLRLLGQSPLRAAQPDVFDNLAGRGPADVTFGLRLPPGAAPLRIDGSVELQGARLSAPRFGLALEEVRGTARYDQEGFSAEGLTAVHEGRPGALTLRAGDGHVRDARNLFEGALRARVDAHTLLAQAGTLEWLRPHVSGSSEWTAGVQVARPAAGGRARPRLRLQSDLVGTTLALPRPLRKPGRTPLATTIETPLPLGDGEVSVALGTRMALRARSRGEDTGIRIALGSARVDAPPSRGLVVGGRTGTLDALEWIGMAGGGSGDDGPGLGRIDVQADALHLLGGRFPDTRLLVIPGSGGALRVRAEGPALEGELRVPASEGAALAGSFQRAWWTRPEQAANGGSASAQPRGTGNEAVAAMAGSGGTAGGADNGDGVDPASIPPLVIVVEDLRVAGAQLGRARLETRPTPAGLQVEELSAQGPGHSIDIDGSWIGRGAQARTRLRAGASTTNLGELLAGTPLQGRLSGGTGGISLRAEWQGTPAEFDAAHARGELVIDVGEGQLLEVEPGAGRVLGLLSVAELPRRLTLDFRDFFNRGLAFNEAGGTIQFGDGVARTEDMAITGPAADIRIRGTADLRAERYNQTIEVMPSTGNLLTVAGAIAGGPVGAAIGAAANAVLQKPMGQIGARTYHVTGPWSDPRVEVIRAEEDAGAGDTGPVVRPDDP